MKINFYATFRPIGGGKTVAIDLPDGSKVTNLVQVVINQQ
jgi:hypothetical protein